MGKLSREEALVVLQRLGFLIPFESVEAYHGRAEKPDENWHVIPSFVSKNFKYGYPLLCTGTKETAEIFANSTSSKSSGTEPKIYKIVTDKKGSMLINRNFDLSKLSEIQIGAYFDAIYTLGTFDLSKMTPPPFEYRDAFMNIVNLLVEEVTKSDKSIMTFDFASDVYDKYNIKKSGIDKDYFIKVAGIINTKVLTRINPIYLLFRYSIISNEKYKDKIYFDSKDNLIEYNTNEDEDINIAPFDREYFTSYLYENNIIGFKDDIIFNKDAYILFATENVMTEKDFKLKEERRQKEFFELSNLIKSLKVNSEFMNIFNSSSPEEIVAMLQAYPQIKNLFDKDAGNYEGFTVGEHTETILRVLKDSYEDDLSSEILPYIRLIFALHDIGKGVSVERFEKYRQSEYNVKFADEILKNLHFDKKFIELLNFIIGTSQKFTTNIFVRENLDSKDRFLMECKNKLTEIFGKNITEKEVYELAKICTILQTCDSGAYTPYATTRDKVTGVYYKNDNKWFAEPFAVPTDFVQRKLRFKLLNGEISNENNSQNSEFGEE